MHPGVILKKRFQFKRLSPNGVSFRGSSSNKKGLQSSAEGTVDRITGKVDATEDLLYSNGSMDTLTWDLRCKPTKPLF
jgi:hypothetical protein